MAEYVSKADLEKVYCLKPCEECRNELCPSELLAGVPTIDIVHCSECKWCGEAEYSPEWEQEYYPCKNKCNRLHRADYFCADGERKE